MAKNKPPSQPQTDNRANQFNPQHRAYHQGRGAGSKQAEKQVHDAGRQKPKG